MQTRRQRSDYARAVVLCLWLGSCASEGREHEVGTYTSALRAHARETLLDDDFEGGALASPPWYAHGDVEVREDAARTDGFGVRIAARGALAAHLDTRGRSRLKLTFQARTLALDGLEALRIEVAVGDHPFFPIAHVRDRDWSQHEVALPHIVEGHAKVRVRFVVAAFGKLHRWQAFEGALLDDVAITAAARADAGPADGGPVDAAVADADVADADIPDAHVAEGGAPDTGVPDGSAPDGGSPDAGACTRDADCSNANVCDGEERCEAGRCVAGSALRCDDGEACSVDRCDPAAGCTHQPGLGLPCEDEGVCDAAGACVACVAPAHTYDALQLRIFDSPLYLCTSCHRAGGRLLDLSAASSYAALLGQTGARAAVTPYDAETSILYDRLRAKVDGTPPVMGGNPMPRGNAPAVTRAELDAIAAWITAGAPRNGVVPGTEALCVPGVAGAGEVPSEQ